MKKIISKGLLVIVLTVGLIGCLGENKEEQAGKKAALAKEFIKHCNGPIKTEIHLNRGDVVISCDDTKLTFFE